jgi:LAO/AO transport system kinase
MIEGADVEAMAKGVAARDRASIAAALNLVEDRRAERRQARRDLLRALAATNANVARTVGVTGPPGAGKSTLCAALAGALTRRGESVGVVAVDPSSVESGGALLGDRVRIVRGDPDPRVFVRSLAAGGALGGLSPAAAECIDVLSRATDTVLVETVGVGQSEIEIARVADVVVLVIQPASGDALQFLKAGVLEIPDLVVVGKSDLGAPAKTAEAELRHALGVGRAVGTRAPKVLLASGATGDGVDALVTAIDACFEASKNDGTLAARRDAAALARAVDVLRRRVGEVGVDALGGEDALLPLLLSFLRTGVTALDAAERVSDEAVARLRSPRFSGKKG